MKRKANAKGKRKERLVLRVVGRNHTVLAETGGAWLLDQKKTFVDQDDLKLQGPPEFLPRLEVLVGGSS